MFFVLDDLYYYYFGIFYYSNPSSNIISLLENITTLIYESVKGIHITIKINKSNKWNEGIPKAMLNYAD